MTQFNIPWIIKDINCHQENHITAFRRNVPVRISIVIQR